MQIRKLPDNLVNRIAAGEVIERPFAAVKELVENSIDAGASRIEVSVREGGKAMITVTDNGIGMSADDLELAVERHATSKLPDDDLVHISSLGFRGEALPSIGAVSKMRIVTRRKDGEAYEINIEGGNKFPVAPSSLNQGTKIEVRELFYATPARLKFMKADKTENQKIREVLERLAMAYPDISFTFNTEERTVFEYNATSPLARLAQVMGDDFTNNAIAINAEREGIRLSGFAGLPTLHRATSQYQYFYVNGRPVTDKLIIGAAKAAYMDLMENGRFPMLCLFLQIEHGEVDVNVHPSKAEVRFRDSQAVRGLIVSGLKHALAEAANKTTNTLSDGALRSFKWDGGYDQPASEYKYNKGLEGREYYGRAYAQPQNRSLPEFDMAPQAKTANYYQTPTEPETERDYPLGAARAQLHRNYIITQTLNGLVIVDQHAAHERLVFEKMKQAMHEGGIKRQALLLPEVVELDESATENLLAHSAELAELGLIIEGFGRGAVTVSEIPSLIGQHDIKQLIRDIADDIAAYGQSVSLKEKLEDILGNIACHGSVRSGRILSIDEMNHLLREMEATPYSGQCNHGRPTYIELDLKDIEKLFGRK